MNNVGFIGWRGMVGSVLMDRMIAENDFNKIKPIFFTTSQVGQLAPEIGVELPKLADAYDINQLKALDIIVTCQGSDYTQIVLPQLRKLDWKGYWIDAASSLRMNDDSIIVLDPLNRQHIDNAIKNGIKNYIGGNCTVSLMMLAISGLLQENLVEWVSSMTYQAISGSGAKAMQELLEQMGFLAKDLKSTNIIELEKSLRLKTQSSEFPNNIIGNTLALNLLPWIDSAMENGQTREEWKASAEMNKILDAKHVIPVDGICVRISSLRSHSQALTIKLKEDIPLERINEILKNGNEWVRFVDNNKEDTFKSLTPISTSGTLDIAVGRVKKTNISPYHINLFTVGDQLLWGAAEPLRRILNILVTNKY
jgi:aspartate-semialdehyde dehydrogenase